MAEEGGEKKQEEVKRHTYPLIRVSSDFKDSVITQTCLFVPTSVEPVNIT